MSHPVATGRCPPSAAGVCVISHVLSRGAARNSRVSTARSVFGLVSLRQTSRNGPDRSLVILEHLPPFRFWEVLSSQLHGFESNEVGNCFVCFYTFCHPHSGVSPDMRSLPPVNPRGPEDTACKPQVQSPPVVDSRPDVLQQLADTEH